MELTNQNFNIYAAKYYDNEYCFTEDEFIQDLKKISTIKRMVSWLSNGDDINVHLLINNTISFYNVFDNHAASKMLEFKMEDRHWPIMNAILYFLSMPLIGDQTYSIILHRRIAQEFKR